MSGKPLANDDTREFDTGIQPLRERVDAIDAQLLSLLNARAAVVADIYALKARHGADHRAILRWAAWSHLRAGHRRAALRAYAGAVLAGDVASVARAAVALLHPRPSTARRPSRPSTPDVAWLAAAQRWLDESLGAQPRHRTPDAHA